MAVSPTLIQQAEDKDRDRDSNIRIRIKDRIRTKGRVRDRDKGRDRGVSSPICLGAQQGVPLGPALLPRLHPVSPHPSLSLSE